MTRLQNVCIAIVGAAASLAANPGSARAEAPQWIDGLHSGDNLYRRQYAVWNGETLAVLTSGCSGSADTVMFFLEGDLYTNGNKITRAFNDDVPGSWCSRIDLTNTSGSAKTYTVIITTYYPDTPAPVTVSTWRDSVGQWLSESFSVGGFASRYTGTYSGTQDARLMVVPVRANRGGLPMDSVLYSINPAIGAVSHFDDDSGFQWLSETQTVSCATNQTCWAIAGNYWENTYGGYFMLWNEWWPLNHPWYTHPDSDGDGVSDGIEIDLAASGLEPVLSEYQPDSDGDGLKDIVELLGVQNGLAGGDTALVMPWQDADASRQDLFVEIDWMEDSSHSDRPYSALAADLSSIFLSDTSYTSRSITPHVVVSQAVGHWSGISFGSCSGVDKVNFYTIKNNPSFFDPLLASVYHYVIAGHQQLNGDCALIDSSGIAEVSGNDVIITLQNIGTDDMTRGTNVHELGHNLFLDHNANNNAAGKSCVHSSVMNYRYQFGGWSNSGDPSVPGDILRSFGYSRGWCQSGSNGLTCANSCTSRCVPSGQVTPKASCPLATSGPNAGKRVSNGVCDCDRDEWENPGYTPVANKVSLYFSPTTYLSGVEQSAAEEYVHGGLGERKLMGAKHRQIANRKAEFLRSQGMVEGRDFRQNPENGKIYAVE